MKEYGDISEGCDDLLQDGMTFTLDYRQGSKEGDDNPMWAPASPTPEGWFFGDEGL